MSGRLLAVAAGALLAAGAARAEMIGDELAAQLADMGCVAEEEALVEAWVNEGFAVEDIEAQAAVLEEQGMLVREEGGRLRLVGWGECG